MNILDSVSSNALVKVIDGGNDALMRMAQISGTSSITINTQVDSYTLVATDAGKLVSIDKATAVNLTVPSNDTVPFKVGTTITVKRSGAGVITFVEGSGVTITASSGSLTDAGQNVYVTLVKTGTNTWDLQNGTNPVWAAYVPVYTGFSADPGSVVARYVLIGKMCTVHLRSNDGTSNATTMTVTLPFAAASTGVQEGLVISTNSGVRAVGRVQTANGSNILSVFSSVTGAAFTASGGKSVYLCGFTYEIA